MTNKTSTHLIEHVGKPVIKNRNGKSNIVLLCEHASNFIPEPWNNLGLRDEHLQTHHAWDAGAADLTIALSQLLDAPAVFSGVSRLFLDYNRPPRHPLQYPAKIDNVVVPGNADLSDKEICERERIAYFPLSDLTEQLLEEKSKTGDIPILVTVHSCEPEWEGALRPWPVAIISEWDRRLAEPLVALLKEQQDQPVGDNQPYDGRESRGNTLVHHAGSRRIPHAALEMRKDVLSTESGVIYWSEIIAKALKKLAN